MLASPCPISWHRQCRPTEHVWLAQLLQTGEPGLRFFEISVPSPGFPACQGWQTPAARWKHRGAKWLAQGHPSGRVENLESQYFTLFTVPCCLLLPLPIHSHLILNIFPRCSYFPKLLWGLGIWWSLLPILSSNNAFKISQLNSIFQFLQIKNNIVF